MEKGGEPHEVQPKVEKQAEAVGALDFKLALFGVLWDRVDDHQRVVLRAVGCGTVDKRQLDHRRRHRLSGFFVVAHFSRKDRHLCHRVLFGQTAVPQA